MPSVADNNLQLQKKPICLLAERIHRPRKHFGELPIRSKAPNVHGLSVSRAGTEEPQNVTLKYRWSIPSLGSERSRVMLERLEQNFKEQTEISDLGEDLLHSLNSDLDSLQQKVARLDTGSTKFIIQIAMPLLVIREAWLVIEDSKNIRQQVQRKLRGISCVHDNRHDVLVNEAHAAIETALELLELVFEKYNIASNHLRVVGWALDVEFPEAKLKTFQ